MEPLKPLVIHPRIMCILGLLLCGGSCLPALLFGGPHISMPSIGYWTVQQHPYSTIKLLDVLYDKLSLTSTSSISLGSRMHQEPLHHAPPGLIFLL
jgi:hypothetical protein